MSSAAAAQILHRVWDGWLDWQRSPPWPVLLVGLLASVVLLLAFHQVVRGAVERSEQRRQATAARATATWRCNTLSGVGLSEGCLARLSAEARDEALPLPRSAQR